LYTFQNGTEQAAFEGQRERYVAALIKVTTHDGFSLTVIVEKLDSGYTQVRVMKRARMGVGIEATNRLIGDKQLTVKIADHTALWRRSLM
jgi:hypothetical protein